MEDSSTWEEKEFSKRYIYIQIYIYILLSRDWTDFPFTGSGWISSVLLSIVCKAATI